MKSSVLGGTHHAEEGREAGREVVYVRGHGVRVRVGYEVMQQSVGRGVCRGAALVSDGLSRLLDVRHGP